jgi:hypothetical protein
MVTAAMLLSTSAAQLPAATATFSTTITKTMVTSDGMFGGCMAKLATDPKTVLGTCGALWVTFSCTGDYTDVVRAYRMLDQAQLALAGSRTVSVQIDDGQKINGYCMVRRIDVQ